MQMSDISNTASKPTLSYFRWAFIITALGIVLGAFLGYQSTGTLLGAATGAFICAVLGVLEISLSFDNAIVNAKKLQDMSPSWRKAFLTWGILIAVFGMRIVFPLLIVAIAAHLGPVEAVKLAIEEPAEYARILTGAHLPIAAFGGTFLMMVGLNYFFDGDKDVHWFAPLEKLLSHGSAVKGIEIAIVLIAILTFSSFLPAEEGVTFFYCAIYGLLTFLGVELLGEVLDASQETLSAAAKGGLGAFIYLEILDASFSFDGVIGAFALTQNLFIIAIGLGIGAIYVRSMTVMLVEKDTLAEFRYLEHGAFYAILVLASIMYLQTLVHIPEAITGLAGATFIGLALWSSVRYKKANPEVEGDEENVPAIAAE
jgi:hypothetical protein